MQISDEMIERAASAMFSHGDEGMWEALSKNRREFWRSYALEGLEAALSAAAPQPAPSVAVKAIEAVWKYSLVIESSVRRGDGPDQYACVTEALRLIKEARSALSAQAQGECKIMAAQIEMGHGKVDVSKIEHEGRSGILFRPRASVIPVGQPGELPAGEYWPVSGDVVIWIANENGAQVIEKYLAYFLPDRSAQVQDVAGWQPIETAPKDGTPVILWTVWVGDEISPDPFSEVQIGYWDHGNDLPKSHDFSRRPEWVVQRIGEPTHWMPLPSAPAKQEG